MEGALAPSDTKMIMKDFDLQILQSTIVILRQELIGQKWTCPFNRLQSIFIEASCLVSQY